MANPIKIIDRLIETQQRVGDFIQNGPSTGVGGWVRDRYRDRCDQASNIPPWLLALSPIGRQSISNWCQPYWDSQGTDGPISEPPFEGGQCAALYGLSGDVEYQTFVASTGETFQSSLDVSGSADLLGPISGFSFRYDTPGSSGNRRWIMDVETATGTVEGYRSFLNPVSANSVSNATFAGSLVIEAGQTDDCGDPPPVIKPGPNPAPDPGPLPGPEPTDDPDGGPFPSFPIPDWPGPLADYPIIDPPPDSPFDPDDLPSGGGDGLPGTDDAIGGEAGEATGGEDGEDVDFGEPPEGRVWVGCIVETTTDSRIGNIPGTGPQSTVWPSVRGNVALKYGSRYGKSERINSRFHELFRPNTALIVTGCFIQAQPGSTLKVFPISALTCPDNPCGDEEDG